jgi:maltose alpha-D-glucosyltransferase / alpha-amylase
MKASSVGRSVPALSSDPDAGAARALADLAMSSGESPVLPRPELASRPLPNTQITRAELADAHGWHRLAVFYEVIVRSFADSNGDGVGDLPGLTSKLDYLAWLGVDCLWLPPFYPSPLRDGGYDVSHFTEVDPAAGTLAEFSTFLAAAHQRGMRVIVDFVLNHTSDQHLWFQQSRADPTGPFGEFYVWADDDTGRAGVPIIFPDTETSNWAFDPVRKQYYWHRFYTHQPDLNYANPDVRSAILDALRFWLDLGVDGFRLDAVPYLFAEEGTTCAHLPQTHDFLHEVRTLLDTQYPGRILLAEANGLPEEVAAYFGTGDECHMAFNFPLMPRIFSALRREDRTPITDVIAQTPPTPSNCQWGIFLRNHDELTLETVDPDERTYLWAEYAADPRMRANLGIRRRLAPLLDHDLNRTELVTALLLSLPGSPILYYGDEIGMGDNIWLGDRDGVRTPMQWSPDRNGGFSASEPGHLLLPLNMDAVHGYQALNVEAQQRNPSSLLHWTQRMIQLRKQNPAFGLGTYLDVHGDNPRILSYIRHYDGDSVLCINNLSRYAQATELDLGPWSGYRPIELAGGHAFPTIDGDRYAVTVGAHGFYWLRLVAPAA